MLQKKIKYTDFNDVERTETFYFNLTKTELAEMQNSKNGGLDKFMQRIVDTTDQPELMKLFKQIILKSYGIKSDDGKRFMKSEELSREFEESLAFDELFMSFMENPDELTAFVQGILPKDISSQIKNQKVITG